MVIPNKNSSADGDVGKPTVSIIIPTVGDRPTLLRRAIDSALSGMPDAAVEILLIPNGPDHSWAGVVAQWKSHPHIKIHTISTANASAARNEGIKHAAGVLVRFLDDDDFLLPEVAARQYQEILQHNADVSSYAIRSENEYGDSIESFLPFKCFDFAVSCLSPNRLQLTHAHVYRLNLIRDLRWPVQTRWAEDVVWLHQICRNSEVKWVSSEECVGVWYQHKGPRVSLMQASHSPHAAIAKSTIETIWHLQKGNRLDASRLNSGIDALWTCIHRAFYLKPIYWHRIALFAFHLEPASTYSPRVAPYNHSTLKLINPLLLEWLLLPKRYLNHLVRKVKGHLLGWNYVRKL